MYEKAKVHLADGTFNLSTNTFKMTLHTSSSNANTLSGSEKFADITNELTTANGYTAGGVVLTGVTWTNTAGTITFTSGTATWNATGSGITARFGLIRASGTLGGLVDPILGVFLTDATPADITVAAGNSLTITMNASGVFTLSGMVTD
jgi:hypothetical protein